MGLSNEDVQEIVRLLDDLDATELKLRTRHFSLWLRRDGRPGDGQWVQAMSTPSTPSTPHRLDPPEPPSTPDRPGLVAVRTSMAGTFYRAPKPGAPPFVAVGAMVEEETVVGIVETMKLMNSVYAGVRGQVAEIRLANAEVARPGAVLMWIAPEQE